MDLIKESFKYANSAGYFKILLFLYFNFIVLEIITAELMSRVADSTINLIPYIVIMKLVMPVILNIIITRLQTTIVYKMAVKYSEDALEKYNRLSFESKNQLPVYLFWTKLEDAIESMDTIINWGLDAVCELVGSFLGCILVFIRTGLIFELVITCLINWLIYYFIILKMQNKFNHTRKKIKKENDMTKSKILISLAGFQYKEVAPAHISNLITNIKNNDMTKRNHNEKIMKSASILNEICMLALGYLIMDDTATFVLILTIILNMSNAVRSCMRFIGQSNKMVTDYDAYQQMWDNLSFKNDPVRLSLPKIMKITRVNVQKGNFSLGLDNKLKEINIGLGSKIFIKGKTGHGKTTFIEGITGKIDGVEFDTCKPENFYHTTADMYQNIKENFPSSNVTIRHYFKDEIDENLINYCLEFCFETNELIRLFDALKKNESDKNDIHPFDCEIKGILSGGQKSRLCLATRIYEMEKYHKQILILDEPEQGSDPEVAGLILANIFDKYRDKTIILVTHMCECQSFKKKIIWTHQLEIDNGVIREKK